ncbi:CRISPR-associated protein Cmr1 [Thermosipho japonicus]|uniref:CRISPR-associated protein Cmr1 n=1 Tax=Thermosipho japonicus TaxID=90323 RepID=A0A841GNP0_9BACT|nr:RAMP superfamily CRISPR-associated protein [Thermosipho japonicus]MBB6062784.1 CRISPR-associated protein Cmr1 [Thermosipho japonicus]
MNKELKIKFKTLSPLWTGNYKGITNEIRPSSLIGSLRFWLDVVCYFSGLQINDLGNFDSKNFQNFILKEGIDFESLNKIFSEFKLSLSSKIFGCNDWKGWIRIKKIKPVGKYCFGNYLNLDNSYRNPYFWGTFEVAFEIEEKIINPIFYPLLYFMELYGFWGGKWSLGYGRLQVVNIKMDGKVLNKWQWRENEFKFKLFEDENKFFSENSEKSDIVKVEEGEEEDFETLLSKNKKINVLFLENIDGKGYSELIKKLKEIKSNKRNGYKISKYLFGSKKEGSKIFPLVTYQIQKDKYEGGLKVGFISIVNFLKGSEKNE